ncbi:MAG: hypothetical protein JF606_02290 [Burkholderiales bacterium]|nr:hypothetical protein [Burkholderiales bacterium]
MTQSTYYSLGQLQTELKSSRGSFYAVCLKTFGVSMLSSIVVALVFGIAMALGLFSGLGGRSPNAAPESAALIAGLVFLVSRR